MKRRMNVMKRIIKTIIGVMILVTGISIFLYPDYIEWKTQREIHRITEEFQKDDMPDPVSYTHLDVYKRQGTRWKLWSRQELLQRSITLLLKRDIKKAIS